jgi:nucleoside-diphosphate-sugar epimerase
MKIVITGANGYIGSRLTKFLSQNDHQITAVCYPTIPDIKKWDVSNVSFLLGDLRSEETILKIADINADAIIHLVSLDHNESERDPNFVTGINILPTWNLLNKCSSTKLKKFIYFSTIHVYGKNQSGIVDESQKSTPFNAYGLTHYLSEEILNYYNRKTNVECINVRLANSYGEPVFEDANCWTIIINDLCRSAFYKKEIRLRSNGKQVRDFIHYSDICRNINELLLLNDKELESNILHFSSGNSISMLDAAAQVQSVFFEKYGYLIPIYINSDELWNVEPKFQPIADIISNELTKNMGLTFEKSLSCGIEDLFKYFEEL